jgi:molybdenum cofactor cytidylyltransferase
MNVDALILAAGNSERMGFPKAFLQFDETKTFIDEIVNQYREFSCMKVCVVINKQSEVQISKLLPETQKYAQFLVNENPNRGRFSSIKIGLNHLSDSEAVFIQNIDNPFIGALLLQHLTDIILDFDYCIPTYENRGGHPILIKNSVVQKALSEPDETILKNFLQQFQVKKIAVDDPKILLNINTFEEYNQIFGK